MVALQTRRADEAFTVIRKLIDEDGYPPTVRSLAEAMGVTPSSAYWYMIVLRTQGKVDWEERKPRTLHVLDDGHGEEAAA